MELITRKCRCRILLQIVMIIFWLINGKRLINRRVFLMVYKLSLFPDLIDQVSMYAAWILTHEYLRSKTLFNSPCYMVMFFWCATTCFWCRILNRTRWVEARLVTMYHRDWKGIDLQQPSILRQFRKNAIPILRVILYKMLLRICRCQICTTAFPRPATIVLIAFIEYTCDWKKKQA